MNSFLSLLRRLGINKTIKYSILRWLGLDTVKSELETIHYFLNASVDITSIPSTKDNDLRNLQLCNTELLAYVAKLCDKYKLNYWLDFGTLLGAIRHKDCIPWDDDVDIAMPRDDYNRFFVLAKDDLKKVGIDVVPCQFWQGLSYQHKNTGIWIDIFPYDYYRSEGDYDYARNQLKSIIPTGVRIGVLKEDRHYNEYLYLANKDTSIFRFHRYSEVFPLRNASYGRYSFSVPNDSSMYLKTLYGDYMSLPKYGVLHHNKNGNSLSSLAIKQGVDMSNVLKNLEKINE